MTLVKSELPRGSRGADGEIGIGYVVMSMAIVREKLEDYTRRVRLGAETRTMMKATNYYRSTPRVRVVSQSCVTCEWLSPK